VTSAAAACHNAIVMNPPGNVLRPFALALAFVLAAACVPARAAAVGEAAPAFTLRDASGATVSLEALRGRVVLLDFWASWCGPCRRSFPWMGEMQRRYGAQGLAVVAVNVDRRRGDADRFLDAVPAGFAVVFDASGSTPSAYAVPAMPTSYLIDAAGRIAHVEPGFRDETTGDMEARIRALIGKRS